MRALFSAAIANCKGFLMADWNAAAIVGLVGGFIGAIGGALSLRDRYLKGRPIASLSTGTSGTQKLLTIRIKNTTDYDALITGANEASGTYFLTEDWRVGNILRSQLKEGMFQPFMLKPGEGKELVLMPKLDGVRMEVLGNRNVRVMIYWRRGNSTGVPRLPMAVTANTQTIRRIAGLGSP
jgi:hypothetical protein